jgi:NAD(P)-dependent dehydrogenase (short-subunit alcohol dehydrogenase family)
MMKTLEATSFGATSTTEDVLSGLNLHGKRILVTGVSAGLGVETARSLAAHGAHIVGAARDLAKAKAAIGGRYCEDCHVSKTVPDSVAVDAMTEGVREYALDPRNAEALWKKSEELVGESF